MLFSISMSGISAAVCIINVLGVLFAFLDELMTELSLVPVSDVLLAKAKATRPLHRLEATVVSCPETTAHVESATWGVCSPETSSLAPEDTETNALRSTASSNTPESTMVAAISSTDIVEVDGNNFNAIGCDSDPDGQHTDTCGMESSITASASPVLEDTSSATLDPMRVKVMSNDAQTSEDGDTQINSGPARDQAKMLACAVEQYDTVSSNSIPSCGPDASDEVVTDAPGQGNCTSSFSQCPSPELGNEPIAIDAMFDDICTANEITQDSSLAKAITSLEASKSPVQGDQNPDAMSELDISEHDIRLASESDFSPKSFASSLASTVPSASSMSASHEQSYDTSDEILGIEPQMDSFFDTQPVADSQPHTPTDEPASSKVDFRTLNPSLRPQYGFEFPNSEQMISISMGMTGRDTYRPTLETGTTEWLSQAWTTDDMLGIEQSEGSFTTLERDDPICSTTCERVPKRLQGPTKFEPFGSANPHQDIHEMTQQKVPASLPIPSLTADSPSVPPTTFGRVAAASTPSRLFCVTIPLNNNNNSVGAAQEAEVMLYQYHVGQTHDGNAYPGATLQDKEDCRVHAYRPDLHTIAALVVEERNVTKRDSTDSEADVIDTSFIPQAVRQHAESQKKSRQAANHGNSQKGKKSKKSKKKTGRLNKERACVEKVLQPADEEAVDIPGMLQKPKEKIIGSELPKNGREQDSASKESSKKKGKRRHRRQKRSQDTQTKQPILSTTMPVDERMPEKHGMISSETSALQDTEIENNPCSEAPSDHCDEAELSTKPLEDGSTMECAVTTLEPPTDPSTNVMEAIDDQVKSSVSDADTGAITHLTCNDVEAAQGDTNHDALEASLIPPEEDETMSAKGNLPVTVDDAITEIATDEDTYDGDCHAAAAHEMVCQPSHLIKLILTPILEEVEPETDTPVNDAGVESCHTVVRLSASEAAAPSSCREAMGDSTSTLYNAEADNDMQLTHFVQQEPLQQRQIGYSTEPAAYREYPHPTQAYNHGSWPNYEQEPVAKYYHYKEPNVSYQYPFSNQLPEYFTPYYDYEPYEGYPQPQYFEPFYDQSYEFYNQLPLSRYEPNGYATPRRLQISWQEWQPYAERYPGQPFGKRTHMKEQKDKPWYLQTLGYEEELEEEFETSNPTQRERTRRSCRKYGL